MRTAKSTRKTIVLEPPEVAILRAETARLRKLNPGHQLSFSSVVRGMLHRAAAIPAPEEKPDRQEAPADA